MRIRITKNIDVEHGEQIPLEGFPKLHDGITMLKPDRSRSATYTVKHLASEDQDWNNMLTLCGKDNYEPLHSLHGMILPSGDGVVHSICDVCIAIACKIQNIPTTRKSRKIIDL